MKPKLVIIALLIVLAALVLTLIVAAADGKLVLRFESPSFFEERHNGDAPPERRFVNHRFT